MPDGRIEPRQVERLRQMGRWLDRYGRSIYGTRGGPFKPGPWGASTHKGNDVYVHILNWSSEKLTLPAVGKQIVASSNLTGGTVRVSQTAENIEISVPQGNRQEIDTIVKLQLDGPAGDVAPVGLPSASLAHEKKARASNVYRRNRHYGADMALDDDPATRWATDTGTKQAWLEVDLGKAVTFDHVKIAEAYDRVRKFELQYRDGAQWKTFTEGARIGDAYSKTFEPVTARHVRLNILESTDGPTIWEFQLMAPKRAST
jgi:alpha-L-fucosidase